MHPHDDSAAPAALGLRDGLRRARRAPDPPGLDALRGNNAPRLKALVKLVHAMCRGRAGCEVYLGSCSIGKALGVSQPTAHRMLKRLVALGIIGPKWTGGMCRRAPDGTGYNGGNLVRRATEYVWLGLSHLASQSEK
jgi:hypothetical protein